MKVTPVVLLASVITSIALASTSLIDPKNDPDLQPHLARGYYELKENDHPRSDITLRDAEEIRTDFLNYAKPLLKDNTRKLDIQISWDLPYYTAHARYTETSLFIGMWGGFLRAPGMNKSIIATTLCHELGHLVGGTPKQTNDEGENISTEGQSDFYAALKCTANFLRSYPQHAPKISEEVRNFCEGNKDCENSLESGLQTFAFLQKWGFTAYEPVSIHKQAPETDTFVPNTYPVYQCRLDSFTRAATCMKENRAETCTPPPCWWPVNLPYPPAN